MSARERGEADREAFVLLCAHVDRCLPPGWTDAATALFSVIQLRWEQSEAEDGETFVDFLRAYADVLEEEDGSAAHPVYPSRAASRPGPESLS